MSRSAPRLITPLDLPLIRRVMGQSLLLDVSTALTRGIPGLEEALLSALPLADLGAPTMVYRNGDRDYVGQFRHRMGEPVARLTLLAPEPQEGSTHDWTRMLEALTVAAGRRGAHHVNAEVAENHPAFVAFRMAGFAVYARQVILRRAPGKIANHGSALLRPEMDCDAIAINTLFTNTVPRLLQQAEPLPELGNGGLVYEQEGQIAGYLAVNEGKSGVVIKPYFHPEVYGRASAVILSALTHIPRAERVPVYLYARAYQDWLRGALEQVEFEPWAQQALMVKYALVRIERPESTLLPNLEANRLNPPVTDGPMPLYKRMIVRKQKKP